MTSETNILIVDDDKEIRDLLGDFLAQYSYHIFLAKDGSEMKKILAKEKISLIVLDVMLPGEDGLTLCRHVRSQSNLPIIMLTAAGTETDRIIGLEIGADDYVAKPFNPRELLARIKAVLRRIHETSDEDKQNEKQCVRFAGWTLNLVNRVLQSPEELEISLSAGEYDLLVTFINHSQRILSRDFLLDATKNRQAGPFDRSIDIQISRLRHKIEQDPKHPILIKTVRSGGYIFTPTIERFA